MKKCRTQASGAATSLFGAPTFRSEVSHLNLFTSVQLAYQARCCRRRYTDKVCGLGAFSYYCGDELTARGGSALLEKELVRVLLPVLPQARAASDIVRCSEPPLSGWHAYSTAAIKCV